MLKPKARALAELMVLEPKLTNLQYAEKIGIDPKTVYKWKKTEEFKAYIDELCKEKFKDLEKLAIAKLGEAIARGNVQAITYTLNSLGYAAPTKVEADIGGEMNININIVE